MKRKDLHNEEILQHLVNVFNRALDHVSHRDTRTLIDLAAAITSAQVAIKRITGKPESAVIDVTAEIIYERESNERVESTEPLPPEV